MKPCTEQEMAAVVVAYLKDLVDGVAHHYASDSSARGNLCRMIREGVIQGIRIEGGRPLRLFPVTDA